MSCQETLKQISVLLVEDEMTLAKLLQEAIGSRFGRFVLAHDGVEGLEAANRFQPDIVITDITMPRMDGLKMSAKLRKDHPGLPIVILSAYSEKDYLLEAIDVGVTKYLIKPFDPDELLEVICVLAKKLERHSDLTLLTPFHFDFVADKLFRNGTMVRLSKRENRFLSLLARKRDHFMSPDEIKADLWDEENISDERLRVFINRLRQKTDPDLIVNLVGQGYALRTDRKHGDKK